MTEAMQMTLSKAIANRIDDSSSTAARRRCEPRSSSKPVVEALMIQAKKSRSEVRACLGGLMAGLDCQHPEYPARD